MKKFSKLLLFIMDLEKDLANQLVVQTVSDDPNAILTNAAHDAVYKILQQGYDLLKEDFVGSELLGATDLQPPELKLKLVK